MRLLILTQAVDPRSQAMGFFHNWLQEFAKHFESVIVICLTEGEYNLPKNVRVFSLGKEAGMSRLRYVLRFFAYVWRERRNYDAVFVHMNQEYVLLGGILWRLLRKRVMLWRNHAYGTMFTRLAVFLAHRVFCTSRYSFTARFKRTRIMPVGIDTELFKRIDGVELEESMVLSLGRIDPVKKPELILDAIALLHARGISVSATIVGTSTDPQSEFARAFDERIRTEGMSAYVERRGSVPHAEIVGLFNQHEIFVNATPSGAFDKTILEAAACETMTLTSSADLKGKIDDRCVFTEGDAASLADHMEALFKLPREEKRVLGRSLREFVRANHSLEALVRKIRDDAQS